MAILESVATKHPTSRFGELLHDHRVESGESAKTVSHRCSLGVVEIAQMELGLADLDADQLAEAVAAYAVPRALFPSRRCEVRVDLAAGSISVRVGDADVEETPADRILLAYFELIFTERELAPDTAIPFTALDLDVLRLVLSSRRGQVTEHLQRMVGPFEETLGIEVPTRGTTRRALLLLAAASTVLAGIVVTHEVTSGPAAVPVEVQIGDAVVVTR